LEVAGAQTQRQVECRASSEGELGVVEQLEFAEEGRLQLRGGLGVTGGWGEELCELAVQAVGGAVEGQRGQGEVLGDRELVSDVKEGAGV
jgi:hypothetical protein